MVRAAHPAPSAPDRSGRRLDVLVAIAVVVPPLAWALQLALGYGATEAACSPAGDGDLGGLLPRTWSVLFSAVALVLCLAGLWAAIAARRAGTADDHDRALSFLATAAVVAAALFAVATLLTLAGTAALDPCRP